MIGGKQVMGNGDGVGNSGRQVMGKGDESMRDSGRHVMGMVMRGYRIVGAR